MNVLLTLLLVVVVVALSIAFGVLRTIIGAAVFVLLVNFGVRWLRSVGNAPPEPDVQDVTEELRYVCTVCGLEVKVERASNDKPPRHCMEPMELVGKHEPPLQSV